ncbi:MAG: hypothetical protein AAGE92_01185 [Cyanobacteria bacterium P01_G01_bin.4]
MARKSSCIAKSFLMHDAAIGVSPTAMSLAWPLRPIKLKPYPTGSISDLNLPAFL